MLKIIARKRLSYLFLVFIIILILSMGVSAQEELTLSALKVDLWPEYDRPSMLVIYHATLPPEVSLPVELTFRIPVVAGEPHAVAVRQVDGALYSVVYERRVSGEWGLITFTATTPQVQLEYYDPRLSKQGDQRHFAYQWPGDYAVSSLVIEVQQPVGASNMRLTPGMGSGRQGQDSLQYYSAEIGALAKGATFTIELDYQKDGNALSSESLQVQPSAPLSQETAGRVDWRQALPWVLGVMGVALIASGGWWYWQSGREKSAKQSRRRYKPERAKEEIAAPEGIYCHQCGKRAMAGDRFCRWCGTKLRGEGD